MTDTNTTQSAHAGPWETDRILEMLDRPFNDLLFLAHSVHRHHHDPTRIQVSTLLSIKTGACPEDCAYCPQSAHYETPVERERLLSLDEVLTSARAAKRGGASRFCMGAAWRNPSDKNLDRVIDMVEAVKDEGLETCVTLGMLTASQARRLREAGLDYYNHNLDTSPEYYGEIISTRVYQDRLDTLEHIRMAGIHVCCGGILGMGESRRDRARLLEQLANLPTPPESVPINMLVQVEGTPLEGQAALDPLEFIRTVAVARILMPQSQLRLSAGREQMSDETQALCFFAGANSIFFGERLLTTANPARTHDLQLLERLGLQIEEPQGPGATAGQAAS